MYVSKPTICRKSERDKSKYGNRKVRRSDAMNLTGCSGNFAPDCEGEMPASDEVHVKELMRGMDGIN
jgi:hypothetical protein